MRIAFGEYLSQRSALYLDMNFWIRLRTAAGGGGSQTNAELLQVLRKGVTDGRWFCPISETSFFELLKQSDPASRRATVALIDELSLGASLIGQQERVAIEISHLIHTHSGQGPLHPLKHLVWTRLSCVLGHWHPVVPALDSETLLAVQKSFFDHLWSRPLSELVDYVRADADDPPPFDRLAADVNAANAEYHADIRSFQAGYAIEARGVTDLFGAMALDAVDLMATRAGIDVPPRTAQSRPLENQWKNLIAASLINGTGHKPLGTMHVMASLHAALRWDKARKIKANDFADFDHATAALVYCDAFFTEGPLATLVSQKHVALDQCFDCFVTSEPARALDWLSSLQRA